jgi:tellurite resistance protein
MSSVIFPAYPVPSGHTDTGHMHPGRAPGGHASLGHARRDHIVAAHLMTGPFSPRRSGRRHPRPHPAETLWPGRTTVQAVLTAAAMIACADGRVDHQERRSLVRFLRRIGVLERYGRTATLAAFDQAVRDAAPLDLQQTCVAADCLRSVVNLPGAPLVAQAAALVALADGVAWPQEIALLEVIRDRVGLRAPHRRDDDR